MTQSILEKWPWLEPSFMMRGQLLDLLSDEDLAFSPGGQNVILGRLLREMGDTEYQYIRSLKTLKHDWSYHNTEAGLENSVSRLRTWFEQLDSELLAALSALSYDDLSKLVDRGRFHATLERQVNIYAEAGLIFFGKIMVYLRALNKPLPAEFEEYFG
ncbi:MAG TPA: hypothetical protein VFA41_10225 [Ktedonobacteraceae bacterium]|jgi:hypothetical protein|nr:hypothetical protein [Ktedonobacteraceae bacterium]